MPASSDFEESHGLKVMENPAWFKGWKNLVFGADPLFPFRRRSVLWPTPGNDIGANNP